MGLNYFGTCVAIPAQIFSVFCQSEFLPHKKTSLIGCSVFCTADLLNGNLFGLDWKLFIQGKHNFRLKVLQNIERRNPKTLRFCKCEGN